MHALPGLLRGRSGLIVLSLLLLSGLTVAVFMFMAASKPSQNAEQAAVVTAPETKVDNNTATSGTFVTVGEALAVTPIEQPATETQPIATQSSRSRQRSNSARRIAHKHNSSRVTKFPAVSFENGAVPSAGAGFDSGMVEIEEWSADRKRVVKVPKRLGHGHEAPEPNYPM